MENILLSDFNSFNKITYNDYILEKSFPILSLSNFKDNIKIFKEYNKIIIQEEKQKYEKFLNDSTIFDVLNFINEFDNTVEVFRYKENDISILNCSAMFLADFSTEKIVKYTLTNKLTDINSLWEYTDEFNNQYKLQTIKTTNKFGLNIKHMLDGNKLLLTEDVEGELYITYRVIDLKIQMLKEFIVSELSDLYTYNEVV